MTSINFAYWLQGMFEITDAKELDARQVSIIKNHLNMVFKHDIDPKMGDKEHQQMLNEIHNTPIAESKVKKYGLPSTEEECIEIYGPKPGPEYKWNMHGWYHPDGGQPRC